MISSGYVGTTVARSWVVRALLVVLAILVGPLARAASPLDRLPKDVQHFLHNLPAPAPGKKLIAVFDHDKTLVQGDIGEHFMKWMLRKKHFPNNALIAHAQRANKAGRLDDLDLFKLAVTGMAGMKESRVEALAKRYYDKGFGGWAERIFAPQKVLIAELIKRGVEVHVVSGSNPWIIRQSARYLGVPVENVHGMSVEVKDGRLTDRLVLPVPWQAGKVEAIAAAGLMKHGKIVFASGDSVGDLKMLELPGEHGLSMTVNDADSAAVAKAAKEKGYSRAVFTVKDTLGHGATRP